MSHRILLVEADATIRKHLVGLIRRLGHDCAPVASLAAALDELRQRPCSLVIVDLDVACGNPASLAAQMRLADATVRLVALDSHGAPPGDDPAHQSFDAVIPKPFLVEPLLATLPALLAARA